MLILFADPCQRNFAHMPHVADSRLGNREGIKTRRLKPGEPFYLQCHRCLCLVVDLIRSWMTAEIPKESLFYLYAESVLCIISLH
jgi:hypothetical protein